MNPILFDHVRALIQDLAHRFEKQKEEMILELMDELLDSSVDKPLRVLWIGAVLPAVLHVGRAFHERKVFVPDIMPIIMTTRRIRELAEKKGHTEYVYGEYPIVIGTVQGDVCRLGKDVVRWMLEAAGFPVFDLGTSAPADVFAEGVISRDAKVVGISCFLTTFLPHVKEVVDRLEKRGLRERVKVVAGGAIMTRNLALSMGADEYGEDAWEAVVRIMGLLGLDGAA